ncbi:iron ABC transporter permease [Actinomadura chibensis]|uniref:Iron ABC transporter permease n=1 Tax=Actinomadura chibensis TaxID=392828 RepID=A0A5D0NC36_9ACTN|nr:iron ABC transporter permease [Actinomadura chibensis]
MGVAAVRQGRRGPQAAPRHVVLRGAAQRRAPRRPGGGRARAVSVAPAPGRVAGTGRLAVPKPALLFGLGLALLAAAAVWNLVEGASGLSVHAVLGAVFAPDGGGEDVLVRQVRLPRVAAALVVGAGLGVSGALFQSVTRNPLGSPDILGVNAGAFLAAVLAALYLPSLPGVPTIAIALAGGLATSALVYTVAASVRPTPLRLALSGVAVTLMLAAASGGLQLLHDVETAGLFFWGQGTIVQDGWDDVRLTGPLTVAGVVLALGLSRPLDVLALGDTTARSLGQRVGLIRVVSWVAAVALGSIAVSLAGPIGFVGLMAPHIARLSGLRRHVLLLPASALWGAVIVLASDDIARLFGSNVQEVPAGVVTAVLGLPFLVWLARRSVGGQIDESATADRTRSRRPALRYGATVTLAAAALAAVVTASLLIGDTPLSELSDFVLWHMRAPRTLVALAAGAALAASGVILQGVLRNPLGEPALVGVMPGATIGALGVLLVFPALPIALLPVAAFTGGVLLFAVAYACAWQSGGVAPARLALVGVGFSAAGTGIVSLIVIDSQLQLSQALVWLTGSTYARSWADLLHLLPWIAVLVPLAWVGGRQLDLFPLGDAAMRGLGMRLERVRLGLLALAVALAATAVAVVGAMAFVGLVAPHIARLLGGGRTRRLLPLAALIGALVVVAADLVGRTALSPKEIPSGVITALVGTPFFIWLLWRTRR